MIRFDCPQCGKRIKVKDDLGGKKGKCPGCGHMLRVPTASQQPQPKPPPAPLRPPKPTESLPPEALPPHDITPSSPPVPDVAIQVNVQQTSRATHSLGISSLVLGILSFFVCWLPFVGLFFGALGVVLGGIGLFLAFARKGTGIGFSIAGTAVSSVALVTGLAFMFAVANAVVSVDQSLKNIGSDLSSPPVKREPVTSDGPAADEGRRSDKERQDTVKTAYISEYMELYDVTAKYMASLLDGRVPGVLFKLRNKGDKALNRVEVTVYFKDAMGNIITEDKYHPVLVGEFSFSGDNKPLKPGFIWQMESGKFYSAKSVPSEWDEGNIDAAITDIEFAE